MRQNHLKVFLVLVVLASQFSLAQRSKDTIRPDRLIITKQYTPTVNQANKLKTIPQIDASKEKQQHQLSYPLVDYPVASTFSPEKGRPATLNRNIDAESYFDNYARIGFGNFTTVLAEFYGKLDLNEKQQLAIHAYHRSSQGGIDEVELDDSFSISNLGLNFTSQEEFFSWETYADFNYLGFNYYATPQFPFSVQDVENLDTSIGYFGVNLGGKLSVEDSFLNYVKLDYTNFGDRFNNNENHLRIVPELVYSLFNKNFDTQFTFDYLSGGFKEQYNDPTLSFDYGYMQLAAAPSMRIDEDRFSIHIGAEIAHLSNLEASSSDVFVYPKIRGSYKISQDNLIAYGGVDGGLDNNTYAGLAMTNPFLSPTLFIAPTNRQYDAFIGLKGGDFGWSYNTKVSYKAEENRAMFYSNFPVNSMQDNDISVFRTGNSFALAYNDINTLGVDVEIDYELSKTVKAGIHLNYSAYGVEDTSDYDEALNLPNLYASLFTNIKLTEKLTTSVSLFYVGERFDLVQDDESFEILTRKVDDFLDMNVQVNYAINNQFTAFLSGMNLFGGNYQRWNNYLVQDIQIMGGVSYQFDW